MLFEKANWKDLVAPMDLAQLSAEASDASFYAKYPAELADEMCKLCLEYRQTKFQSLSWFSVFTNSPNWWRLFHSLLPNCPIDPAPFRKHADILDGIYCEAVMFGMDQLDEGWIQQLEPAMDGIEDEVAFFGMWLEATDRWKDRPVAEEVVDHRQRAEQRRENAKALRDKSGVPTDDDHERVEAFIQKHKTKNNGQEPTQKAIREGCNISPGKVTQIVDALRNEGKWTTPPRKRRT